MIEPRLRQCLIEALMRVPGINELGARSLLLTNVPNAHLRVRFENNALRDIEVIIIQLDDMYSPEGVLWLLHIVDNGLRYVRETDLSDELQRLRGQLERSMSIPVRPSVSECVKPYSFDLSRLVDLCLSCVRGSPRLSGFVIQTSSLDLIESLCESLKHRSDEYVPWGRANVTVPRKMVVGPKWASVEEVIMTVGRCKDMLKTNHVIRCVMLEEAGDAPMLWEGISADFSGELENHLVVLMGVPDGCPSPPGVLELPPPAFERQHAKEWFKNIVTTMGWSNYLVDDWVQLIEPFCSDNTFAGTWDVHKVYYELKRCQDRLSGCRNEDDFRAKLEEAKLEAMLDIGGFYVIAR